MKSSFLNKQYEILLENNPSSTTKGFKDIAIQVNQRHLIDKILARYSSEYTIYRELIQNANDANAKQLCINFHHNSRDEGSGIDSICVQNNGRDFSQQDWNRLAKIAEGNPDEDKIGFFGVGFYSLFSVCEGPFVVSGDRGMLFVWKGDQLFARHAHINNFTDNGEQENNGLRAGWTSVFLKLRNQNALPTERAHLDSFAQFLAKSLLFTEHLQEISVLSDSELLFKVRKQALLNDQNEPNNVQISLSSLSSPKSLPTGIFSLQAVECHSFKLVFEKQYRGGDNKEGNSEKDGFMAGLWSFARKLISDPKDLEKQAIYNGHGIFEICLQSTTSSCKFSESFFSSSFSTEFERIVKKTPPKKFKLSFIHPDLKNGRFGDSVNTHPVLTGTVPMDDQGHLFIGFETQQSTGIRAHIAGPFIPTVERESLDFVDACLSKWNQELLSLSSKMSFLLYNQAMQALSANEQKSEKDQRLAKNNHIDADINQVMETFCCLPSTPSIIVGKLMARNFFTCSNGPILIASTKGIVGVDSLRTIPASLMTLQLSLDIPMPLDANTPHYSKEAQAFTRILTRNYEVKQATFSEIIKALDKESISSNDQLISFMHWIIQFNRDQGITNKQFKLMISKLYAPQSNHKHEWICLKSFKYFCEFDFLDDANHLNLPSDCISPLISRQFKACELEECFNLKSFKLGDCLSFWLSEKKLTRKAALSILINTERNIKKQSPEDQVMICNQLANHPIIPIRVKGRIIFKTPPACYLPSVAKKGNCFDGADFGLECLIEDDDLITHVSSTFLVAIGVNGHYSIKTLLQNNSLPRNIIKYCHSIRNQLSNQEKSLVREARIFTAINAKPEKKFTICELWVDHPIHKILHLPIVEWKDGSSVVKSQYRQTMIEFGLCEYAPLGLIIDSIEKGSDFGHNEMHLLDYLLDNWLTADYPNKWKNTFEAHKHAIIPVIDGNKNKLMSVNNAFLDTPLGILGYSIVIPKFSSKVLFLGVREHPPIHEMIDKLQQCTEMGRLTSLEKSQRLFEYFDDLDMEREHFSRLHTIPFIVCSPLNRNSSNFYKNQNDLEKRIIHHAPNNVFFEGPSSGGGQTLRASSNWIIIGELFKGKAITFLQNCGVRRRPEINEIIAKLCEDPQKVLEEAGVEEYKRIFIWIANHPWHTISELNVERLKKVACLLAWRRRKTIDGEDETKTTFTLTTSSNIVIDNDSRLAAIFSEQALLAPIDDLSLENLYRAIGVKFISESCEQRTEFIDCISKRSDETEKLQSLIRERSPLLLACNGNKTVDASRTSSLKEKLNCIRVEKCAKISKIITFDQSHESITQPTTCTLDSNDNILMITVPFEYFDVGSVLAGMICGKDNVVGLGDCLLFASVLESGLDGLRMRGFPVDRLLHDSKGVFEEQERSIISSEKNSPDNFESKEITKMRHNDKVNSRTPADLPVTNAEPSLAKETKSKRSILSTITATISKFAQKSGKDKAIVTSQPPSQKQLHEYIKSFTRKHSGALSLSRQPQPTLSEQYRRSKRFESLASDSYCRLLDADSLVYVGECESVAVYATKTNNASVDINMQLLRSSKLQSFIHRLSSLTSHVFKIDASSLHVFHSEHSPIIAFNRGGCLFFNLHFEGVGGDEALFMTTCHELAHNHVGDHDAMHEYWMSMYAQTFMAKFFAWKYGFGDYHR